MVGTLLSTSLAAGADLKVIQDMLGHSSIVLTADTYTNPRELHQTGEVCPV
jgi:site-specific recombinase XerD